MIILAVALLLLSFLFFFFPLGFNLRASKSCLYNEIPLRIRDKHVYLNKAIQEELSELPREADGHSVIVRDLNLCSANLHLQITIAGGTHSDLPEVGG